MRFEAWLAGNYAGIVTLQIIAGNSLDIAVDQTGIGESVAITITTIANTTNEDDLAQALLANPAFNIACRLITDPTTVHNAVAPLARTLFDPPALGLLQTLEASMAILGWGDRELQAKDKPVGLIFPGHTTGVTAGNIADVNDKWTSEVMIGVAFQTAAENPATIEIDRAREYVRQTSLLDLFRLQLWAVTKTFEHQWMEGSLEEVVYGYANTLKDETLNTLLPSARVRVVGTYTLRYESPGFIIPPVSWAATDLQIGLWRNPIDELPGAADSALDSIIHIPKHP